tara:strand:- start:14523 stop:15197 length:675 start_codon:yes stop_codon:yes gene_type:complete
MNSTDFRKLVAKHFSPSIRKLGWKGSGFDFRKIEDNHVVNIFGIQGSWMGGSVCCETAVHFDFFSDLSGQKDFNKTKYSSCLLRSRLSPDGEGDYHWVFSDNQTQNIESVKSILKAFENHGLNFYKEFQDFPHPFVDIRVMDLEVNNNYKVLDKYYVGNGMGIARFLKEINLFIGNRTVAEEFSEYGIKMATELADRLLVGRKTKTYKKTEEFINMKIKEFKIK